MLLIMLRSLSLKMSKWREPNGFLLCLECLRERYIRTVFRSVLPKVEQFSTEEECLDLESVQPFRIEWRLERRKREPSHIWTQVAV